MTSPTDSEQGVIDVRGLSRTLGDRVQNHVLRGVDLQIMRGDFVAITGSSGSGKSTLLYLMGVLDKPTSGQVLVDGIDTSLMRDHERAALRNRRIGYVFQFHFLLPEFSVLENVMLPMLRGGSSRQLAQERGLHTLGELGLGELSHRGPGELSGGQQQRVAIARAIAGTPSVLLADEPTGSLDAANGQKVFALFESLNATRGMTIVLVTHDRELAERAGRQVIMQDGRILEERQTGRVRP